MAINDAADVYVHTGIMTSGSHWDILFSGNVGIIFSLSFFLCILDKLRFIWLFKGTVSP